MYAHAKLFKAITWILLIYPYNSGLVSFNIFNYFWTYFNIYIPLLGWLVFVKFRDYLVFWYKLLMVSINFININQIKILKHFFFMNNYINNYHKTIFHIFLLFPWLLYFQLFFFKVSNYKFFLCFLNRYHNSFFVYFFINIKPFTFCLIILINHYCNYIKLFAIFWILIFSFYS